MSLVAAFNGIKTNFKLTPKIYSIDNVIFKLHYRATVLIFLVASVLVTSRQYIGEHIRCIADGGVPENVMNTFCFFTTTFTVIKHLDPEMVRQGQLPHLGVGPYDGGNSTDPIKKHAYYQWVPFVLFGQGIMFYMTHLMWKKLEGGRIKALAETLRFAAYSLQDKELTINSQKIPTRVNREASIQQVQRAFIERIFINGSWALYLIMCEILNVLHVVLQFYITDAFLGGQFTYLGCDIMRDGLDANVDILDEVFPKVTKCTFHKYGPSGSIQLHDAMCVMALNIINDKIYTFLWFWFVFLFAVSVLGLLWRALTIALHSRSRAFNRMVFATTFSGKVNPWNVLTVSKYCNFTDWLFLKYLAKNVDGLVFKEIFVGLAEQLEEKKPLIDMEDEESSSKMD